MRRQLGLAVRIVFTVLVSIIIPLVTGLAHNKAGRPILTPVEQFGTGCFVFLAITLTGISFDLGQLLKLREDEHEVWSIRQQVDGYLQNIRAAYVTILNNGTVLDENLPAQYFARILSSVSDDITEAAAKNELRVDELTFGTTDLLMKVMVHRGSQSLRLVHALDARPNNFDFTTWSRSYYAELTRLVGEGKLSSVKRLFLYGEDADLTDPLAQKLIAFHRANKGYDYRVLSRADWSNLVRGFGLHYAHHEIGIWGDLLAYIALKSSSADMQGFYTFLPQQIERLGELFEAAWRLGDRRDPVDGAGPVTVEDLFSLGSTAAAFSRPAIPEGGVGLTGEGPGHASLSVS